MIGRGGGATGGRTAGGDLEPGGRVARRSFDRCAGRVRRDQRYRHVSIARCDASVLERTAGSRAGGVSLLARLDRRGVRLAGRQRQFTETTAYAPNSPYSASKAAGDHFVRAFHHTYGLPTITTNCSNNYGPFQFPEKLIPLVTLNAIEGKPLPVYGQGKNVRDWLFVEDHVQGLLAALEHGRPGEVYNLGGDCERTNLELVEILVRHCRRVMPNVACAADAEVDHVSRRSARARFAVRDRRQQSKARTGLATKDRVVRRPASHRAVVSRQPDVGRARHQWRLSARAIGIKCKRLKPISRFNRESHRVPLLARLAVLVSGIALLDKQTVAPRVSACD